MNRVMAACAFAALVAVTLVSVQCDLVSGGPPTEVQIVADSDTTVVLVWAPPAEGTPSAYLVSFKEVGKQAYAPLGQTEDTIFFHNPHGVTGSYKVMAQFGGETYEALTKPSTVPILTDTLFQGELNAATSAGYGWRRETGVGAVFAMDDELNEKEVDFYITDFNSGFSGPKYWIASPDLGPTDPGGGVPVAGWRVSGFTPALVYEDMPLPAYSPSYYLEKQRIDTVPVAVACRTEDGYFALVKFTRQETGLGRVQVKSWFQLVKGLRLIKH